MQRVVALNDPGRAIEKDVAFLYLLFSHGDDAGDHTAVIEFNGELARKLAAVEPPPPRQYRFAGQRQPPAIDLVGNGDFVQSFSTAVGDRAPRLDVQTPAVV